MQCPKCHRENGPGSRLCNFCGSPLPVAGTAPGTQSAAQEIRELREEVSNLSQSLRLITERLARLEGMPEAVGPSVPSEAAPPVTREEPVSVEEPQPEPVSRPREWEQILGGNWLARIGVITLLFGAAFFVKFAIDNKWINPIGWVTLGILAGLLMLAGGYFWRKRYPTFAQALSGGGIGLLYLSVFSASAVARFLPLALAVVCLFLISAGSSILAIKYDSKAIAILGIVGAFVAPFAIGGTVRQATAVQGGSGISLIVYVLVIDLGVLALSTFRNWRWFTLIALFGSLMTFGVWSTLKQSLLLSEVCLTTMFLIFVAATTLHHVIRRQHSGVFDYALMIINAIAYFSISYGLMQRSLRAWMGGFTFLLAIFYGGLAYAAFKRSAENRRLVYFALGIAVFFLTVALPIQLGSRGWVTAAWATEGVVLLWLASTLRMPGLRHIGYGVFIVMTFRLLFFDTQVHVRTFTPIFNERFLAFLFGIAACYMAGHLVWRERQNLAYWHTVTTIFVVAANFFTVWLFSFEAWNYFGRLIALAGRGSIIDLRNAQNLSLTGLWIIYAVGLLVVGIARGWRLVRFGGLLLLAISIIKVFAYDVWALQTIYRVVAFTGLGLFLLGSGYLYQRFGKAVKGLLKNQ